MRPVGSRLPLSWHGSHCRAALEKNDNVLTFRTHFENERVGVITRQYIFSNLYGTCLFFFPFLLLYGVNACRVEPGWIVVCCVLRALVTQGGAQHTVLASSSRPSTHHSPTPPSSPCLYRPPAHPHPLHRPPVDASSPQHGRKAMDCVPTPAGSGRLPHQQRVSRRHQDGQRLTHVVELGVSHRFRIV